MARRITIVLNVKAPNRMGYVSLTVVGYIIRTKESITIEDMDTKHAYVIPICNVLYEDILEIP